MREILVRIATRLAMMNYNDMTTAERQIVDILVACGYLTRDNAGNVENAK